jgi:type II secretory pathway pseudopilin PulG
MSKQWAGYTMIELLVVVAVTGLLGVSAIMIVMGQQGRTEYTQSVRDFEATMVDIANDVTSGYFPSFSESSRSGRCYLVAGIPTFDSIVSPEQGANPDCIFIGKAVQIGVNGDRKRINVYTLAGRRQVGSRDVQTIIEANPRAVATTADPATGFDLTEEFNMRFGLEGESATPATGVIVFLTGFARSGPTGDVVGSPTTDLYYLSGTSVGDTKANVLAALANPARYIKPGTAGVRICVNRDNRRSHLVFGENNRKLNAAIRIDQATC